MHRTKLAPFIFTLLMALTYGMGVGAYSLLEPDTCFLLAMGRWICQHMTLPTTDPFSYTFAMWAEPQGLVVYQWLTEVIFYAVAKASGTLGLVTFDCVILIWAFLIIPWRIMQHFQVLPLRAAVIAAYVALGSIERMRLRPEIFSYLLLSVYIEVIIRADSKECSTTVNWKLAGTLAGIMALWANLHSGFVIGILLILMVNIKQLGWQFFKHDKNYSVVNTWSVSLLACLIASLITPYGIGLWKYIPHLYFHAMNHFIIELQPISAITLGTLPHFLPFMGLALLAVWQAVRQYQRRLNACDSLYIMFAIVGIGLGLACQRMTAFALLLVLPIIGRGLGMKNANVYLVDLRQRRLYTLITLSAMIGSLGIVLYTHPTIPASSRDCGQPFAAVKYIAINKPSGNLLNDPHFGDVLLWNVENPPKLFHDSRFDVYVWQIMRDYMMMAECLPGWRELFIKYKIDWVFLAPSAKLCSCLETDNQWRIAFKDKNAEIIIRKKMH